MSVFLGIIAYQPGRFALVKAVSYTQYANAEKRESRLRI